jgi:hypothetical protein
MAATRASARARSEIFVMWVVGTRGRATRTPFYQEADRGQAGASDERIDDGARRGRARGSCVPTATLGARGAVDCRVAGLGRARVHTLSAPFTTAGRDRVGWGAAAERDRAVGPPRRLSLATRTDRRALFALCLVAGGSTIQTGLGTQPDGLRCYYRRGARREGLANLQGMAPDARGGPSLGLAQVPAQGRGERRPGRGVGGASVRRRFAPPRGSGRRRGCPRQAS